MSCLANLEYVVAESCDVSGDGNFFQGCSFSPDGLCVLTSTAGDGKLRLYNTVFGGDLVETKAWSSALTMTTGDVVRSYAWYPQMSSQNPASCCFAASSRDQPIHLYDAYTGAIRATYRPFNRLDEMESPTVVTFSADGQRILCGGLRTDRVLHMFDVAVPGRDSTVLRLGQTRRSTDGQKGLVSAMATTPDARYFCVGTYAPGSIYVYDDRASRFASHTVLHGLCVVGHGKGHSRKSKKRRFVYPNDDPSDDSLNILKDDASFIHQAKTHWFQTRAQGGVTQVQFAPHQEYILYSASRRSNCVLVWDLRMLADTSDASRPPIRGIGSFATASDTNQRIEFDVSTDGSTLFVGGVDRCVRVYDTKTGKLMEKVEDLDDTANGVSFTSLSNESSYLAVATGSRRFLKEGDDADDDDDDKECQRKDSAPGYLRLYKLGDGKGTLTNDDAKDESSNT